MTRAALRIAVLGFAAFGAPWTLGACRLNPLEKPTITVQRVQVQSISFSGIDLRLDLAIYNPNSVAVPLKSAEWSLSLVGEDAVSGRADLSESIPAHANAPVTVDVRIGATRAASIGSGIAAGQTDYAIDGTLTFTTRVGDLRVAFSQRGQVARR